jgi:hypothetical protein
MLLGRELAEDRSYATRIHALIACLFLATARGCRKDLLLEIVDEPTGLSLVRILRLFETEKLSLTLQPKESLVRPLRLAAGCGGIDRNHRGRLEHGFQPPGKGESIEALRRAARALQAQELPLTLVQKGLCHGFRNSLLGSRQVIFVAGELVLVGGAGAAHFDAPAAQGGSRHKGKR